MIKQPSYLRYLEEAQKAETAEKLRADGFSVEDEVRVGEVEFDLVARKGGKSIAYEFKAGRSARTGRESLSERQRVAAAQGFEFHIVVVNPPPRVNIEVDALGNYLLEDMIDHLPSELDALSTHTQVDGVSDIEVTDIRVKHDGITVNGRGSVEVELRYGSESDNEFDNGARLYDSYPFYFKATLDTDGGLASVDELSVDTSSFDE